MKYYKVIRNQNVIDLISGETLSYAKYQMKHGVLLLCSANEAMGIIADSGKCYHISSCMPFPVDDYPSVTIEEITEVEYERYQNLLLKTAEEIRADLLLELMERGVL